MTASLLVLAGAATAGTTGRCVVAEIASPFVLPDGSRHDPGSIRICLTRNYSPVAGLHGTYVDGRPVGTFPSRRGESEEIAGEGSSYLVFAREVGGVLRLLGYSVAGPGRPELFRLASPRSNERTSSGRAGSDDAPDLVVLNAVSY